MKSKELPTPAEIEARRIRKAIRVAESAVDEAQGHLNKLLDEVYAGMNEETQGQFSHSPEQFRQKIFMVITRLMFKKIFAHDCTYIVTEDPEMKGAIRLVKQETEGSQRDVDEVLSKIQENMNEVLQAVFPSMEKFSDTILPEVAKLLYRHGDLAELEKQLRTLQETTN